MRLDDVGTSRPSDLAPLFGISKPTLSRQVQLLERLGLIAREPDPTDGRALQLTPSEEGLEKVDAARAARRHRLHVRLEDWSRQDMTSLATLLERLNFAISLTPPSR